MPSLTRLYDEFKNSGFVILAINIKERSEKVKRFAQKEKLPFPVLLDISGQVANKYRVSAHPVHFIIDGTGKMIGKTLGARNWASNKNRDLIRVLVSENKKS